MTEGGSVTRRFVGEVASFFKQMGPVVAGVVAVGAPIWFLAEDTVNEWLAVPERIASIEKRLGEPHIPFVEFQGSAVMWPDQVRPGQRVRVLYMVRRNRDCKTWVERRFQSVDAAIIEPFLTHKEQAPSTPLTLGFELYTERVTIPENIGPGVYAYRPVLFCQDELPVLPPAVFFEVMAV